MLTSWGMAVISTVRAAYRPAPPPSSAPAIITIHPVAVTVPAWATRASVVATAATMPAVDTWLPRRAVAGEFIRCRPNTKQVADRHVQQLGYPVEGAHAWPPRCPACCPAAGAWPFPLTAAVSAAGTGVRDRRNILSIRPVTT